MSHPIIPFITEEIWQKIKELGGTRNDGTENKASIMLASYPRAKGINQQQACQDIDWLKGLILSVRNIRGEMNISPAIQLPLFLNNGNKEDHRKFLEHATYLKSLANLENISWLNPGDAIPQSATQMLGSMEILVPMKGFIDKDAEIERLNKRISKLEIEIGKVSGKLNNEKFVNGAPADVINKEKEKLADFQLTCNKLNEQLNNIKNL